MIVIGSYLYSGCSDCTTEQCGATADCRNANGIAAIIAATVSATTCLHIHRVIHKVTVTSFLPIADAML